MRYWLRPRRLHIRKRPPKVRAAARKRRPHRTARDRLRDFGLSRFRYLWFIPVLIALIVAVANVRVPKTTTVLIQSAAVERGTDEQAPVRSAKYRTSIPAGYRLAVDITWRGEAPAQAVLIELMLRDGVGSAVAKETTVVPSGDLAGEAPVTRAELNVPYNLNGQYALSVRVSDMDAGRHGAETSLGMLTVY